ncbi:MAG: hypothetical protein VYA50_06800 [Chloroflexota bacterium]|jgi:hypothetical protein|nr:hypothetical protein [Chloroflexota bacterium]|tara:strand:- start:155 stop:388 length:234 start_codon:yes stop_codon:yes gene_type:complete
MAVSYTPHRRINPLGATGSWLGTIAGKVTSLAASVNVRVVRVDGDSADEDSSARAVAVVDSVVLVFAGAVGAATGWL